jgi:hypothetical protein
MSSIPASNVQSVARDLHGTILIASAGFALI